MNPERYNRVVELFHVACGLNPASRADFLAEVCGEDEDLRGSVDSMLRADEKSNRFLDEAAYDVAAVVFNAERIARPQPTYIGHYRILSVLGEGGMGIVYEAEQDQPRRTVALKVIKPEMTAPEVLRRFEQESQALGRLQHPGIAQIYEAGTTHRGLGPEPYFAMELIRGDSLLRYAETHKLSTRHRLELMADVCEAVHHAHGRGIIHRDLKPGNILVSETGQPKVLDFGVARVTNSDAQITRQTNVGQIIGTLAYMSPERFLADPMDFDIRSDVYALGVILFELLAGSLPYRLGPQLHDSIRTIREDDPTPLSAVSRSYRGDIEIIVNTALEKDRAHRYSSAEYMADDIRRHLRDEPIAARRPSAIYRFKKFNRRHKALVIGLSTVLLVLVVGIIISTEEAARARRAEQAANAVSDFLRNDLLAQASPNSQARPDVKPDRDIKVRTVLDRAAARISGKFAALPLIEASIRQTVGNTYSDLGLYSDAQRQAARALDLRRRNLGERHPDTLASMHDLATLQWEQGNNAEAERLYAKALEGRRQVLGELHPDTLSSMHYLGLVYLEEAKYSEAESRFRTVLETRRRILGEDHPDTLMVMEDLATLDSRQRKYAEAVPLYTKVLAAQQRVLGKEHPDTLLTMSNFAVAYRDQGRYSQAESLLQKTLEIERRVLGEEHAYTLGTIYSLAKAYFLQRSYERAEFFYTRLLQNQRNATNVDEVWWWAIDDLALLYFNQRNYHKSQMLLQEGLHGPHEIKTDTRFRYSYESLLGANLTSEGRYTEAEPLLLLGYDGMIKYQTTFPRDGRAAVELGAARIAQLYEAWGKPQKAAEWRLKSLPPSPGAH
jgi:serine/threonine protein kinase